MGLENLGTGRDVPNDINVVIEIPSLCSPVKYEVDKHSGMVAVDRFLSTSMYYPCEYGFIPHTLSEDGDPLDVLVVTPYPLFPGAIIRCRPIGMLRMQDESGPDAKILAVPVTKVSALYQHIETPEDLGEAFINKINHFFQHYKDLDKDKWVKIAGWEQVEVAKKEILDGVKRYNNKDIVGFMKG